MASESEGSERLTYSQVIRSSLININGTDSIDQDLNYCGEVLQRAVTKLREYDRKVNLAEVAGDERLNAILALNAMYTLERKFYGPTQE